MPTQNDRYHAIQNRGTFSQEHGIRIPEENHDSFGRLKVGTPETLFETQSQYDAQPDFWNTITANNGSSVYNYNESTVNLTVTSANTDSVIRQTKEYFHYQPGKSQAVLATFVFGTTHANNVQRVGYFDSSDGIFLERSANTTYICLRSNTTGTPVDTKVAQSDWNVNKLDANSFFEMDWTKSQIFFTDIEWLGVGRVRVGFVVNGAFYLAHEFLNSNVLDKVYMKRATLPVRYEIQNTGEAVATQLRSICSTVISEGGQDDKFGVPFAISNSNTLKSINDSAWTPLLSIQPKYTFNGYENRIAIRVDDVGSYTTATAVIRLIYEGELSNATFQSVDANSAVQYDIYANNITGGTIIDEYYLPATQQSKTTTSKDFKFVIPLTTNYWANNANKITVVARTLSGAATAGATFKWHESR